MSRHLQQSLSLAVVLTLSVASQSALGQLVITNGDFETGGGANLENVNSWFDFNTGNFWEGAWQSNAQSFNGTNQIVFSSFEADDFGAPTPDVNDGCYLYQSIGTANGADSVDISFDWGAPTDDPGGRFLGMTVGIYAYDGVGAFTAADGTDVRGAAGVTLLDSQSFTIASSTASGQMVTGVVATLDLSAAGSQELFLRFNGYLPGTGESWPTLDNVSILSGLATWDGDSSNLWNVAANWVDDALPTFTGYSTKLSFSASGAAGGTLSNDVVGAELASILFNSNAAATVLSGNAVSISESVSNESANTQEVAFDVDAAGTLDLNANGGPLVMSGVLSGSSGLTKSGGSSATLSNGSNTISGTITVNSGSLVVAANGALGDPNSTVQFPEATATLALDGGVTLTNPLDLGARAAGAPAQITALSGANTVASSMTAVDQFVFQVESGASLDVAADIAKTVDDGEDMVRAEVFGDMTITGQIDDSATDSQLGVIKYRNGNLALVGTKNYSGPTWGEVGVLSFVDPNSANNVPNSYILQAADPNATLDFTGLMGGGIVLSPDQSLSGGGVFVGSVATSMGSILSPGWLAIDDIGVMALDDLTLAEGTQINLHLSATENDEIVINSGGTLVGPASGTVDINVDVSAGVAMTDYVIMDWSAGSAVDLDLLDFTTDVGSLSIVDSQLILTIGIETRAEVLVSDTGNNRVLKFDVTQFGTLVPNGSQPVFAEGTVGDYELDTPVGLAKDSAGNVYVAEGNLDLQDRVLKLDSNGNFLATIAEIDGNTNDVFSGTPAHIVVDPTDTYLFMSVSQPNSTAGDDTLEDAIYRIRIDDTAPPELYIDTTDLNESYILQDPQGLEFGPDGYLYVCNNLSGVGSSTLGNLTLINANFANGGDSSDALDVTDWYDGDRDNDHDGTANFWEDAWQISRETPNGTAALALSNWPMQNGTGTESWAYQSLGSDATIMSIPVEFDWGSFNDAPGVRGIGIRVSVYESDGSFVADESVDVGSSQADPNDPNSPFDPNILPAGITLLDSQSISSLDVAAGANNLDELLTMDVSAQTGGELFLRFSNFTPAGGSTTEAEGTWCWIDNVSIGGSGGPETGSRVLRFDVSGSTGVYAGTLTTEHRSTKGLFYDTVLDRLLVSLNALNDIWAYTNLALDYVSNDPANGAFAFVYEQDAEANYPDVLAVDGSVFFTDSTDNVIRRVDDVSTTTVVVDASAGLSSPHSLLAINETNPFDFDNDGHVDASDLDEMALAMNGPDVTTPPAGVTAEIFNRADIDNDGDADMQDVWVMQRQAN